MKPGHAVSLMLASATLAACSAASQESKYRSFFRETGADLAGGYRLPPESEYGPLWAFVESSGWQTRDGSGGTKAEFWTSGDFNGDSVRDYAYVLIRAEDSERALYAFMSASGGYVPVVLAPDIAPRMWLATRGPGRYATAEARGIGPDAAATGVTEFEVAYQAIEFFQSEGASSTFVWNEATQGFDRYWTSD